MSLSRMKGRTSSEVCADCNALSKYIEAFFAWQNGKGIYISLYVHITFCLLALF